VTDRLDPGSLSAGSTAQEHGRQRLGYTIASVPFVLLVILQLIAPGFMEPLFSNPPEIIGLPAGIVALLAVMIWAALAFAVIRAFDSVAGSALALIAFTIPSVVAIILLPAVILIVQNLGSD